MKRQSGGVGAKVLGAILALWGIGVVVRGLVVGVPSGASEGYAGGVLAGYIAGGVLGLVGILLILRK